MTDDDVDSILLSVTSWYSKWTLSLMLRNKHCARFLLIKRNHASCSVYVFCTDLPSTAIWNEQSCPISDPNHYESFPHFCQSTRTTTTFSSPIYYLHTVCSPTEQDSKFRSVYNFLELAIKLDRHSVFLYA